MLRLIWNNWKRQKERFLLLLIGVLLMSSGLNYLLGLTETNQGTVEETLGKKWSSAYDIVVRPAGTKNDVQNLLEPNYLNGIAGGITQAQYETIQKMQEIDVAAPIAVMGYGYIGAVWENESNEPKLEPGIYRVRTKTAQNNGLQQTVMNESTDYCIQGKETTEVQFTCDKVYDRGKGFSDPMLIVGIDPEQEAKLVGLDKVTASLPQSRYFDKEDAPKLLRRTEMQDHIEIPIIVNKDSFSNNKQTTTLEKLSLPFETKEQQQKTIEQIKSAKDRKEDDSSLAQAKGKQIEETSTTSKEVEEVYYSSIFGVNPETGSTSQVDSKKNAKVFEGSHIVFKPTPLSYKETKSPYQEQWEKAFQIEEHPLSKMQDDMIDGYIPKSGFRAIELAKHTVDTNKERTFPAIMYRVVGFYNPSKLSVSKDPLNELPLETYRPAKASLVLDENSLPINPAQDITGIGHPAGLLTNPPNMLTTIQAAQMVMGDSAISTIRLKVKGVESFNESSQKKLEAVAKQIEEDTGLVTDITRGSSPQPVLIEVKKEGKTLGWMEQPWINLGAAITILKETTLGYSGVLIVLIGVAILYVLATNIVSLLARRKEMAVLLALGWQAKHLIKMLFFESTILCSIVILVSCVVEGVMYVQTGTFLIGKLLLIAICSILIYLLGTLIPAFLLTKITPYETMRQGEISTKTKRWMRTTNIFMMVGNQVLAKWQRNILSILSIALPTTLLSFYLFVTFRLKGILYTSWLGQYVAMKVDSTHYITMGIAICVAVVTTAEMLWQNISERKPEISVLKSIGWTNSSVRLLVVLEGAFLGFLAGLLGLVFSIIGVYAMYGIFPLESLPMMSITIIIPITVGMLGALIPGEVAVRVKPFLAMKKI
ncbi:ABC transporter permease [Bacillus sp. WLY-B-L8]|uniref:ABC transporter permease n=1 Tax=Bacillus multifaciens TaxID=3068506 RepID=UPI0027407441|nr:FtsX-like permease family protein [Bacillus sp. WLY-B-L8]MDP7977658.1 FtsX-like permease family protein [Bacillus sp. WLY-B-L8]